MSKGYIYSLRFAICPGFHEEEKFSELQNFCRDAGIDDVQFLLNVEELNQGHLTVEQTRVWLDMIAGFKPRLEEMGITVSLNPWTTTLHTDRGRKLKKGQDFTTMADKNGHKAEAVVCPMDPAFRCYLKEIYGMYAELGFDTIWVEDDFRLHNHAPLEWGGCFCKLHMKEFSRRAGARLGKKAFIDMVIQEGNPHPYRKIWLDTVKDTMNDFASLIGEAVHEKAPKTRVGLMSSIPEVHCIEGRDWSQILCNLSGETRPLNRPHLPAYNEDAARWYAINFQRISRLSAAMTREKAQLWPELDNLPHTTFSKSHRFARMEMESTLVLGAEGITLNIFDLTGNGVSPRQKNERMLAVIKPYLSGVRSLNFCLDQERGVYVLFSDKSSYTLHANGKKNMDAIQPCETFWAEYLGVYGIAYHYCDDISVSRKIVAVSGQFFRNLTGEQIERLFAENFMLLDGEAADTLCRMGLGDLAGIREYTWYPLNGGRHSFEQVVGGQIIQELSEARCTAQSISETVESGDYLNIKYGTKEWKTFTVIKAPDGTTVGSGLTLVDGRVAIFPYGHMREQYYFLLNPVRQELFQRLLLSVKKYATPAVVEECQYVTINHFMQEKRHILLATNYSTDDFEDIEVDFPGKVRKVREISRCDGKLIPAEFECRGRKIVLNGTLEHMTSRCFVLE